MNRAHVQLLQLLTTCSSTTCLEEEEAEVLEEEEARRQWHRRQRCLKGSEEGAEVLDLLTLLVQKFRCCDLRRGRRRSGGPSRDCEPS